MTSTLCTSDSVYYRLFNFLHNNTNSSSDCSDTSSDFNSIYSVGRYFYSYFTPVIIIVGIVGNCLSLNVFLSKNLRSLSSSTYLAALSASDLFTVIFYVAVEWIRRGLPYLFPEMNIHLLDFNGMCEIQLYISYVSRFLSAWLVVAFTVERYIGVCFPLLRRDLCTISTTRKIVAGIFFVSAVIVIYKPVLSGMYKSASGNLYCTRSPNHGFVSFVCDSIFAVMITFVPFVIITVLNVRIFQKLFKRRRSRKCKNIITEESIIRLEFTIILLALSICFISFNIPYFVMWCRNFLTSKYVSHSVSSSTDADLKYWQGVLYFVRTIFYVNYCINFFLYLITGAYFRREVRVLFTYRTLRRGSSYNTKAEDANAFLKWI